jgi:hypothetical protein
MIGCLLIIIVLVGCSKSDDNTEVSANKEFDACALLAEADPQSILGEPVGDADRTQHDRLQKAKAPGVTISQCSFYSAKGSSYKSLNLLIKYIDKYENPKTAKAFLDTQQLDFGDFKFEPHEISDLGDVAVSLESSGTFQLWVFWKKNYQMNVSINEVEDNNMALKGSKKVAQIVLNKL